MYKILRLLLVKIPVTVTASFFTKLWIYLIFPLSSSVVSIEDAFDQDDWEHWSQLTGKVGIQIVG